MTRDQAIAYIRSHPDQFKGVSEEEVLSKTQSSNDANYYNPTLFVPEQKRTVVKPNTPTRGATVGPSKPTTKAPQKASTTLASGPTPQGLPATNALIGKLRGPNALPWVLGFLVTGLGITMAVYKASK